MLQFIFTLIINMIGFSVIASGLLPGIRFVGEWPAQLILTALTFAVINTILKPVLKLLTCPFILLTLGLFLFVINAVLLMLTGAISGWLDQNLTFINGYLQVDSFGWAVAGSIILSLLSVFLGWIFDADRTRWWWYRRRVQNQQNQLVQQRAQMDAQFDAYVRSQQAGQVPQQYPPPGQYPPQYPPAQGPYPPTYPPQYPPQGPGQYPPGAPPAYPPQAPPQYPPAQPPYPPQPPPPTRR